MDKLKIKNNEEYTDKLSSLFEKNFNAVFGNNIKNDIIDLFYLNQDINSNKSLDIIANKIENNEKDDNKILNFNEKRHLNNKTIEIFNSFFFKNSIIDNISDDLIEAINHKIKGYIDYTLEKNGSMKVSIEKERIFRIVFLLEKQFKEIYKEYPDFLKVLTELKNIFIIKYIIQIYELCSSNQKKWVDDIIKQLINQSKTYASKVQLILKLRNNLSHFNLNQENFLKEVNMETLISEINGHEKFTKINEGCTRKINNYDIVIEKPGANVALNALGKIYINKIEISFGINSFSKDIFTLDNVNISNLFSKTDYEIIKKSVLFVYLEMLKVEAAKGKEYELEFSNEILNIRKNFNEALFDIENTQNNEINKDENLNNGIKNALLKFKNTDAKDVISFFYKLTNEKPVIKGSHFNFPSGGTKEGSKFTIPLHKGPLKTETLKSIIVNSGYFEDFD